MATSTLAPTPSETERLTLADVTFTFLAGRESVRGVEVERVLRLGGPNQLSHRLLGLLELIKDHEGLEYHELVFVRGALADLADQLFVCDDAGPEAARCWAIERQATEKAGAA